MAVGRDHAVPPAEGRGRLRSDKHPPTAPVGRRPAARAHLSQQGRAHVIRLSGDLDAAGAPVLTRAITDLLSTRPASATTVVVDLSTIGVLAAAGITALVEAEQACGDVVQLCWVGPERVRRVLAAVGLADDIDWLDTRSTRGPNA